MDTHYNSALLTLFFFFLNHCHDQLYFFISYTSFVSHTFRMLSMRSKTNLLFMIEKEGGIIFLFLGFFSFSLIFRQIFFPREYNGKAMRWAEKRNGEKFVML